MSQIQFTSSMAVVLTGSLLAVVLTGSLPVAFFQKPPHSLSVGGPIADIYEVMTKVLSLRKATP